MVVTLWSVWRMPVVAAIATGFLATLACTHMVYRQGRWLQEVVDSSGCLVCFALYFAWAVLVLLLLWQLNFDLALAVSLSAPVVIAVIGYILADSGRTPLQPRSRRRR